MFTKNRTIVGIDVGTRTVKVVIARISSGTASRIPPQIVAVGTAESRGMREGYIINAPAAARSIRAALQSARVSAGTDITRAYLAVGGVGLAECRARGEVITSRADSEISPPDLEKVIADSEERARADIPNRKILHAIPLSYTIDNEPVLGRPRGMRGTKLEVEAMFITCLEQHLTDLITAVENAGVAVDDVLASPLAASFVTTTKTQRRAGCVLADIGAETISIAVFENHAPVSLRVFPGGGSMLTNDIALGLKISLDEAEKIKRGGGPTGTYSKRKLEEIIRARLSTFCAQIDGHLRKIKRDALLPAGVIFTGGGSGSADLEGIARSALRLPARKTLLDPAQNGKVRDPAFAVAYGLCVWGAEGGGEESGIRVARRAGNSLLNWFTQFLP